MFLLGSSKQYHPYAVKLSSLSPAEPSHNVDCQYLLAVFVHGLCATKSPSHSVITDTSLSLHNMQFFSFCFMIVFMHMVCLCFLFQPHYIHSALPALVSLAFCVCRLLQLPRENAQVILLILQTWEQKKGGYIKAGGPNGFFLLNFYTLTTFFFIWGEI